MNVNVTEIAPDIFRISFYEPGYPVNFGCFLNTLACHHGSVLKGDPHRYYRALRQNAVGDVIDAPFYEMRLNAKV